MDKKKKHLSKSNPTTKKVDTKTKEIKPKRETKAGVIRSWITANPKGGFAQCEKDCGMKVSKPYFYSIKYKMKKGKAAKVQPKKPAKRSKAKLNIDALIAETEKLQPKLPAPSDYTRCLIQAETATPHGYANWWLEGQILGYFHKMFKEIYE